MFKDQGGITKYIYFVTSVLHPKTIAPIAQFHIPCLIKNSFSPQGVGILIIQDIGENNL